MQVPRMPDLEPNPKKVVRRKRTTTKSTRASLPSAQKKELPRSSASQPRDHLGRFACVAGRALVGVARRTGRAVAGTVKTANKAPKAIKNQQKQARRRQNIEIRERAVAVREREQKVKKKIVRRKR